MNQIQKYEEYLQLFCQLFDFSRTDNIEINDYVPNDPFELIEFDRTLLSTYSSKDVLDFLVAERLLTYFSYNSFNTFCNSKNINFSEFNRTLEFLKIPIRSRSAYKLSYTQATLKTSDELVFLILLVIEELILVEGWKISEVTELITTKPVGSLLRTLEERIRVRCISQVSPALIHIPGMVDFNKFVGIFDPNESDKVRNWDRVLFRFMVLTYFLNKELLSIPNKRLRQILLSNHCPGINPSGVEKKISHFKTLLDLPKG